MSKDLNKCMFIGRIGQDIELRSLPNGTACVNLSLAVGDDYKDKNTGQKVEQTEWVRCTMFGRSAEVVSEYCRKGSKLYVEGKMKTRSYDKDNQKHYATEVMVSEFYMLDGKDPGQSSQNRPASGQSSQSARQAPAEMDSFDDDVPF